MDAVTIIVCVCMSLGGSFDKEYKTDEERALEKKEEMEEDIKEEMKR